MEKIKESVFDAGPFIHLDEIKNTKFIFLFKRILTTKEIIKECKGILISNLSNVIITELNPISKDFTKYISEKYSVDLGESTGIALCKQEKIKFFFTDDLEARKAAEDLGFESHGTIAIILRSYRERLLTKKETKEAVENLYRKSSLFITKDLVDWTLKEIDNYN